MKILKRLWLYLKYRQEINHHYGYAMNEGYASEGYNWLDRTIYWLKSE